MPSRREADDAERGANAPDSGANADADSRANADADSRANADADSGDPAGESADPAALARAYYDAIDAGEYERLASLLDPEFVQRRGDRTFEGRDRFVAFMRDGRPNTDTTHAVDRVYPSGPGVAVRGRLRDVDGDVLFAFVDVFETEAGRLTSLETYGAESSDG
ncbi:Ketosteroid isomerase-related protein [Halorubrum ezzemoulense]|uniref:Ketosteroid isomerase-related protein n=1 Tax=Halorubrum ezzemoulense TaxID=337243 RepID=A0A238UNW2_HALEZ|nr:MULTISPECIES: nuclear transport factor 2 family protein [Halorubrum]TKX39095.1 nuclear transport factor 2 family protein [Halorubrum sp. CGM4_25_10-8A]SNR23621.1 Ketosteroid isomerase-related protein [Halorubrum ezzemoulense]